MVLGFSTGCLALDDFRRGLKIVDGKELAAIELSALRDTELIPLVESLDSLDLEQFSYISVHAPSQLQTLNEAQVLDALQPVFRRGWNVVFHPDTFEDLSILNPFGELVCIENMDKRKPVGRTAKELSKVFAELPNASFCFDIAHAKQIDPTMMEARKILSQHGHRLAQVHLSAVNSASQHEPLSYPSMISYREITGLIPRTIPVILETPIPEESVVAEMERAMRLFQ